MKRISLCMARAFLAITFIAGCGSSQQTYVETPTVVPTNTELVKQGLEALAQSGQPDSGTELLKPEIEKLRGTAGVDADALLKGLDFMMSGKPVGQVQAKAKEMLAKLPK